MRFGVCTWVWIAPFTETGAAELATHVRGLGFDVLELCIEDPSGVTGEQLRAVREETGIEYSVCGAFGPDRDLASTNAEYRENALAYLDRLSALAGAIDAPNVVGPLYSAVGKARTEDPGEWGRSVEGIKRAAEVAAGRGVGIAVEPLNRYETDLVNSAEQGLELCDAVGAENVGLLLDTYHMNIEEKSVGDAIRLAGDRLFHVHTCENDRGTPGTGHVPWDEVFAALRDVGYDGQAVIESFTPQVKEIARAVSLWRPLDAEGDELAARGLRFLKSVAG